MREGTKGLRRRVWNQTLFCRDIKICCDVCTFWKSLGKKESFFLYQKQCFFVKKCSITWYIMQIILSKISKFAITCKNDILSRNSKYALDKNLYGYLCLRRKAANFCHPAMNIFFNSQNIYSSHPDPFIHPFNMFTNC